MVGLLQEPKSVAEPDAPALADEEEVELEALDEDEEEVEFEAFEEEEVELLEEDEVLVEVLFEKPAPDPLLEPLPPLPLWPWPLPLPFLEPESESFPGPEPCWEVDEVEPELEFELEDEEELVLPVLAPEEPAFPAGGATALQPPTTEPVKAPAFPALEPDEPASLEPAVEDEELPADEPDEDVDDELPTLPALPLDALAAAPAAAAAVLAASSTPTLDAVTPRAALNWSAAEASPFFPLIAEAAVRHAETVAAAALHWSFRRSQMKLATMPGSIKIC